MTISYLLKTAIITWLISTEKNLIVNTEITERDHIFVNRIGIVCSCPLTGDATIKKGDDVILHHNVFRKWYDSHQVEKNSASFLSENRYLVASDQIYAYKRNSEWKCLPDYCFVKPIYKDDEWALHTDENLSGELVYLNKKLEDLGLSKGSIVGFTPNSEYEFTIDGQKLYRILSNQITINYGSTTKNSSSG